MLTPGQRVDQESDVIRKRGTDFQIQRELEAIAFVRKHTSIPVPTILDAQLCSNESCMLMQRALGTCLETAWPQMHEKAKAKTTKQLEAYFKQLRDIPQPEAAGWVGSCNKGPAYDHRLNNGFPCGPFTSLSEFHDFIVAPVQRCPRPQLATVYRKRLSDDYQVHFAHADLSYEHVFVDQDTGDVTAIIDWEMAGFWPAWWEYRKALYCSRQQRWWMDLVDRIMPSYMEELEIDSDLEAF